MGISSGLGAAALAPAGLSFRNKLINGGFDIWQRWVATSIDVASGATGYTADRWFMSPVGALMGAIRDTSVPPENNSRYSLAITPNGVGGSTCRLGQKIESANVYGLKGFVTFSAWIYNNTGSAITPTLLLGTPSAADNFTTVTNMLTQPLQSCSNATWTKVAHTVDISGYSNINNGLQVEIQTSGHTTYGKIVKVADVQLERGSVATPFEQRPIGIEDILCKRYYQVWSNSSNTNFMSIGSSLYSTPMSLSVPMRPLTSTSTSFVAVVYAQGTSYALNSLGVTVFDSSRPHYFTLSGSMSGSWNYSWPICTFNTHTCIFNGEL
jgi:hypothetical protein